MVASTGRRGNPGGASRKNGHVSIRELPLAAIWPSPENEQLYRPGSPHRRLTGGQVCRSLAAWRSLSSWVASLGIFQVPHEPTMHPHLPALITKDVVPVLVSLVPFEAGLLCRPVDEAQIAILGKILRAAYHQNIDDNGGPTLGSVLGPNSSPRNTQSLGSHHLPSVEGRLSSVDCGVPVYARAGAGTRGKYARARHQKGVRNILTLQFDNS